MIKQSRHFRIFLYISAIVLFVYVMAPVTWLFISSISYQRDLTSVPLRLNAANFTFQRYADIIFNPTNDLANNFKWAMVNSLIVALVVTALGLVTGSLTSYAFARLRFPAKKPLLYLLLFTYMIPPVVIVFPLYSVINRLGMLDSKLTLIILYLSMCVPFVVWVMQSYFGSISRSFEEAALIDGCSRMQTLRLVYLPMAKPGIIATGILAFLLSWDEFFFSLIFTSTLNAKTMPLAIAEFSGKNAVDFGMIATGGIIASLPPLLITIIFQRQIVTGMTAGGNKE